MKRRPAAVVLLLALGLGLASSAGLERVANDFANGTKKYSAPILERQIRYGDFFEGVGQKVQYLINEVAVELYRQARFQSELLGNGAVSAVDRIENELSNSDGQGRNERLDRLLETLNSNLEAFLEFAQGSDAPPSKDLPQIGEPEVVKPHLPYHPLKDLFLSLESIFDGHLANIRSVLNGFYVEGWKSARAGLPQLQQQFRDGLLNGSLADVYRTVVNNVYKNAEKLRDSVKPETWSKFNSQASTVKRLFPQKNES